MFNLNSFISSNYSGALSYAKCCGLQKSDAEDFCQNVFVEFCKKVESGRVDISKNVLAYLFQIIRWRLKDHLRSSNARENGLSQVGEENNMDELPFVESGDKEKKHKKNILISATKNIRGKPSPRDYKIFVAQVFGDKNAEETAEMFNVSLPVVHLAKHRVGKHVIEEGKKLAKQNGI